MLTRTLSLWLTAVTLHFSLYGFAQNVAINEDGSAPNTNAILDVKSLTKGVLLPRVSTAGRLAIPNTKGMLVYDTTTSSYWFNTGTAWQNLSAAAGSTGTGWLLTGNSGTDSSSFIGTTDFKPFLVKANNTLSGRIDPRFTGNTFWGYNTAPSLKQDSALYNTAVGNSSMFSLTTGIANTAIGALSLMNITSGSYNTATGEGVLATNSTGNNNTGTGFQALDVNTTGNNNSAFGSNSLKLNSTGSTNSTFGSFSMQANTTGFDNTATGFTALYNNTTGNSNTATGSRALFSNTTGTINTATGIYSMYSTTTGSSNTANGQYSLYTNTTGWYNTAMGGFALFNNKTASDNTAIGYGALTANKTGGINTAVGESSLGSNTDGYENTAVGIQALYYNTSGFDNTAIGAFAECPSTGAVSNATAIGAYAVVNVSNKVRIGNSAVTVIEGQVPFTTPSDGRFKFRVQEDVKGLDFIMHLRPVTYQFDVKRFDEEQLHQTGDQKTPQVNKVIQAAYTEAAAIRRSGFIAQEVERAADAAGYNFSGIIKPKTQQEHYSLSYEAFVVPLVKGMQEQQRIIDAQSRELADLKQQIAELSRLVHSSTTK